MRRERTWVVVLRRHAVKRAAPLAGHVGAAGGVHGRDRAATRQAAWRAHAALLNTDAAAGQTGPGPAGRPPTGAHNGGRAMATFLAISQSQVRYGKGRRTFPSWVASFLALGDAALFPPCGADRLPSAQKRVKVRAKWSRSAGDSWSAFTIGSSDFTWHAITAR